MTTVHPAPTEDYWQDASWETHWKRCFTHGFAPQWSNEQLQQLLGALETDDTRLIQGRTCDWRLELGDPRAIGCCGVSFVGLSGGLSFIDDLQSYFSRTCNAADEALGQKARCRFFLNWFDSTPRSRMRVELAAVIREVLEEREGGMRNAP